jgi:tRNA dimethylallyltransferase
MDIGTAKPGSEERVAVPHHLIDVVDPDQDFSLALYQELACRAIGDIQGRGKLPFLAGGSGLYIWSVIEGWQIPHVPPNPELRANLQEKASREGILTLYRELEEVDPEAARAIDPRNLRRIIRGIEVYKITSIPFSQLRRKVPPPFEALIIGLTVDREELYRRIDSRVDSMIERGLIDETKKLMEMGYSPTLPSMSGLGYRQIASFLSGEIDLATAVQQIKFETHRFARYQYTWFRLNDKQIHWVDITEDIQQFSLNLIEEFMGETWRENKQPC